MRRWKKGECKIWMQRYGLRLSEAGVMLAAARAIVFKKRANSSRKGEFERTKKNQKSVVVWKTRGWVFLSSEGRKGRVKNLIFSSALIHENTLSWSSPWVIHEFFLEQPYSFMKPSSQIFTPFLGRKRTQEGESWHEWGLSASLRVTQHLRKHVYLLLMRVGLQPMSHEIFLIFLGKLENI